MARLAGPAFLPPLFLCFFLLYIRNQIKPGRADAESGDKAALHLDALLTPLKKETETDSDCLV
jgi:hypothetical protein